jgi:xanthine dehydrogenase accessory factor
MVLSDGHDPEPADGDLALVVAAHGRDELHALRRGLEVRLPYVGLVASERRGAGVLDELRADGVGEDLLERVDVPAGVPIGSLTAGEIAVSILARVVSVRRADVGRPPGPDQGGRREPERAPSQAASLAVDPICGMTVAAVDGTPSVERHGETIYFCSEGCKSKYEEQEEHASFAR